VIADPSYHSLAVKVSCSIVKVGLSETAIAMAIVAWWGRNVRLYVQGSFGNSALGLALSRPEAV
jgi:hypothetical protein